MQLNTEKGNAIKVLSIITPQREPFKEKKYLFLYPGEESNNDESSLL